MRSVEAEKIVSTLFAHRSKPFPSIPELRLIMARDMAGKPLPASIEAEAGAAGSTPGEWLTASARSHSGSLLFLHGGAHIAGGSCTHRAFAAQLALATALRVFVADYRLAPEHPFPASLDDALSAYDHLEATCASGEPLFIAGDSSGGGLCLALLLSLRAAKRPMPRAAILLSPWTDLTLCGTSYRTRAAVDPVDRVPALRRFAVDYAPVERHRDPLVSPIFSDPRGLPPLMLQVGDHETMLDDSVQLARRAVAAGVSVSLHTWPEMWHGWQLLDPPVPETTAAIAEIATFVRRHTARTLEDQNAPDS